jgi:hypothetical protein
MWIERDDRRRPAGRYGGLEHSPVTQMDAVEGPDRGRARLPL